MISFDFAQETSASATGTIVESKGDKSEGTLSFSALLQGVKEDSERPQNSALLLSLDDTSISQEEPNVKETKSSLLSLLGVEDDNMVDLDSLEINPELKEALSSQDMKLLVKDAKTYLKDQIINSDGFKRSEVDKLPKTLKGLTQAAEKIGIDISKITLEEVSQESKNSVLSDAFETNEELVKIKNNIQKNEQKSSSNTSDSSKNLALFQTKKENSISTEQIVNVKNFHAVKDKEPIKSKKQNDETLKLLLQGESSVKKESSGLTNDFSVASAKVIAPTATTTTTITGRGQNSLTTLLNPESVKKDDESSIKTEAVHVAKTDSFEVKLNEAKQMVKYLSQDVKQAIDNYKAPFTRVKVQLNPAQLGEIELTVVQRGKDLHVNLSSNNSAINTLAMNASDLKQQLQNSGINNASLNFSNNSQSGESGYSGQQQQQQGRAHDEYNYFENEEQNEEIISSLEIVVPNYA